MKKKILAAVMLGILLTFTACKKDPAQAGPIEAEETTEENGEETVQLQESLELKLEEGTEGSIAPD